MEKDTSKGVEAKIQAAKGNPRAKIKLEHPCAFLGLLEQELAETFHLVRSVLQRSNESTNVESAFHRLTRTRRALRDDNGMDLPLPGHFKGRGKHGRRSFVVSISFVR